MKKLLFISHPASGDIEGNRKKVMRICQYWWRRGYVPVAPHLLFSYMDSDRDRKWIMLICYALILACPVFLCYGESPGCNDELAFAKKTGRIIKIMYDRPNYKKMMEDPGERK